MKLVRPYPIILAVIAITTYAAADRDLIAFAIGLPALLIAWWLTKQREGRPWPATAIGTLVVVAVLYTAIRAILDGLRVTTFSQFVILLLVIKTLDQRGARDQAQIMLLSLFLTIGSILTSNSLVVGILLIGSVPIWIRGVLWHQIRSGQERAVRSDPRDQAPSVHLTGAVGRRFGPDLNRMTVIASGLAMLISVGVFLVVPRGLGTGAFGQWGNVSVGQVTGFTDEVQLGVGGLISQSPSPVLDLEVFDTSGQRLGSAGKTYYLRGAVLDEYANGRWRRSDASRRRTDRRTALTESWSFGPEPRHATLEQRITIRNAQRQAHLFAVWQPASVRFEQRADLLFSVERDEFQADGVLIREGEPGKFSYSVRSHEVRRPSELTERVRSVSFESSRITDFTGSLLEAAGFEADPILRPVSEDAAVARLIEEHFRTGYRYTLDTLAAPPSSDPIEWFLFENREGHCEYFASAMAAMCRSIGIDCRVVTGYVATEFNEATQHYIVRASNAHAWVEVEIEPKRWRRFDPTPPSEFDRIHEPSGSVLARVRRMLDTIEYAWIHSVVGFNSTSWEQLFGGRDVGQRVNRWARRVSDPVEQGGWPVLRNAVRNGAAVSVVVFIAGLVILRARRRLGATFSRVLGRINVLLGHVFRPPDAWERAYAKVLQILESAGEPKPTWRPLLDHAKAVSGRDPALGEAVERAARLLYAMKFSGGLSSGDARAIDQIRDAIAAIQANSGDRT